MNAVLPASETRIRVRLCDLGLAPENLRYDEPADAEIPRLADTIAAAGLIYPPLVRAARRGEETPYLVLDGRRRRFAFLELVARGVLAEDAAIDCVLVEARGGQAAAAVLANTERAPVHLADVIAAIGKLRKGRMGTSAIARALGYEELEIRRLEALAAVHPTVLEAFRKDRLSLRQVRMFARVKDRDRQAALARTALEGWFHEYALHGLVHGGRVTVDDPRLRLVGREAYAEAGGRFEADLFCELPEALLDEPILSRLWSARAQAAGLGLFSEGVAVEVSDAEVYRAPEGLLHMRYVRVGAMPEDAQEAFDAAQSQAERAAAALAEADPAADLEPLRAHLLAQLAVARARLSAGSVEAVLLTPCGQAGLEAAFFWRPEPVAEGNASDEGDEAPGEDALEAVAAPEPDVAPAEVEVDVSGATHALHEARTDLATRGLIRALADAPEAATIALLAHLFQQLALTDAGGGALSIRAVAYARPQHGPVASLDGEVRGRLEAFRADYKASGRRPVGWVAGLDPEARGRLLAALVAVCLDLRESRTSSVDRAARAQAGEISALCGADLAAHWTPDAAFLTIHPKVRLLDMLAQMGVEDARAAALKKADLVDVVVREAAARRWVPGVLAWPAPNDPGAAPESDAGEPVAGTEAPEGVAAEPVADAA